VYFDGRAHDDSLSPQPFGHEMSTGSNPRLFSDLREWCKDRLRSEDRGRHLSWFGRAYWREHYDGEYSIVGMGAVVVEEIAAAHVWVGNPARYLRTVQK